MKNLTKYNTVLWSYIQKQVLKCIIIIVLQISELIIQMTGGKTLKAIHPQTNKSDPD